MLYATMRIGNNCEYFLFQSCRNRRPFEELVGNGLFEPPLILKKFNQNQATMESLFIEGFLWILIS